MAEQDRERSPRRRLDSSARRGEILAAAADVIAAQGFLPIPVEQVAGGAGVSKGLIYAYFPTRTALYDAVLTQAVTALAPGIDALERDDFEAFAVACAELYFDDVTSRGALLHILFTDPVLDGHRGAAAEAWRNSLWRRLIRASRAYVRLEPREAVGALAIILSLPEETGRLAHRGEMEVERARGLCTDLVLSALRGLRSAAAAG